MAGNAQFPRVPTLLLMNLFPLAGVLFFNWSFFAIIYIYWWETVILSFFNVLKMAKAAKRAEARPNVTINGAPETESIRNNKPLIMVTYMGTRAFILFIYLVFILVFIGMYQGNRPGQPSMGEIILFMDPFMKAGIVAVLIYYLTDYLVWRFTGDWQETTAASLAMPFDGRSIVMHVVIVLGAVSTAFLGETLFGSEQKAAPILFASFFVIMKTAVDLWAESGKKDRETVVLETLGKKRGNDDARPTTQG